jgi:hypothetical protein
MVGLLFKAGAGSLDLPMGCMKNGGPVKALTPCDYYQREPRGRRRMKRYLLFYGPIGGATGGWHDFPGTTTASKLRLRKLAIRGAMPSGGT